MVLVNFKFGDAITKLFTFFSDLNLNVVVGKDRADCENITGVPALTAVSYSCHAESRIRSVKPGHCSLFTVHCSLATVLTFPAVSGKEPGRDRANWYR